jgi:hypothetical protein
VSEIREFADAFVELVDGCIHGFCPVKDPRKSTRAPAVGIPAGLHHMLSDVEWFKQAFAIDPPGPAQPTDPQRALVDRLCREVVRRRMTTPAHMLLEMGRPLNYLSAQVMHFFQPFVTALADPAAYDQLSTFLEQRGSIEYISQRLQAIEATAHTDARSHHPS